MNEVMVIAGYPGVGKSYFKHMHSKCCSDSDSSKFSWITVKNGDKEEKVRNPKFIEQYIDHIKGVMKKPGIEYVFVSTHNEVLKALYDNNIKFTIFYPARNCKNAYIVRYLTRGSTKEFVNTMSNMWNKFHDDIDEFVYKTGTPVYEMQMWETLESVMKIIN